MSTYKRRPGRAVAGRYGYLGMSDNDGLYGSLGKVGLSVRPWGCPFVHLELRGWRYQASLSNRCGALFLHDRPRNRVRFRMLYNRGSRA